MFDGNSIVINKFPIFVLSSPRTGSTVLAEAISIKYNISWINEPYLIKSTSLPIPADSNYIMKSMARDFLLSSSPEIRENAKTGYVIRTRRSNLVEQIASMYIADSRNRMLYHKDIDPRGYNTPVPINLRRVKIFVKFINRHNYFTHLISQKLNIDLDLDYEEIDGINSPNLIKTIRPDNYEEIKDIVKGLL
jgi:hypothetical protein